MQDKISRIAIMVVRVSGLLTLLLGIALWLGQGGPLLHAHMGCGALLVLALWTLALLGVEAAPRLALLAGVWGLIVPGLGYAQMSLLPGQMHWLVQAIHLLVGLGAMAQAERLAGAMRRSRAASCA